MSRFFSLAVAAVVICCLAGCSTKQTSAPRQQRSKPRIALVMKSLANEFFKTMEDGARKHQAQNSSKYELICNGIKDEGDVTKQIDIVQQMVAQGVDAIVIAPADSKALVSACKKAQQAGVVVVNIDNKLDAAALKSAEIKVPFVGPDNRKGARLAGEVLAKQLKPGDQVAIIEGAPNAYNGIQRKLGFEDAMRAARATVVSSQTGAWEMGKANQVTSGIMAKYPDIKAILCANDNMALGALAAVRSSGKAGKVKIVGFDNISAVSDLVKGGEVLATVDQHADKLAIYGTEYALDILGKKGTPSDRETPVDLVTGPAKENE